MIRMRLQIVFWHAASSLTLFRLKQSELHEITGVEGDKEWTWRQAIPSILLDGMVLTLQPAVSILVVEVNNSLSFTTHVKETASKAACKLNSVRGVSLKTIRRSRGQQPLRRPSPPVIEYAF